MNEFELKNVGTILKVAVYERNRELRISIDDPTNQCMSNNYEGDYAAIELTFEQAKALAQFLNNLEGLRNE
jgi:hypothetical protein